jgi:hypothetical protein
MLELRTSASGLYLLATVVVVAGCGATRQASTGAVSGQGTPVAATSPTRAEAERLAHAVNLVGTDVPQMRLTVPEREPRRQTRSAEAMDRCAIGTVPRDAVLIHSAKFVHVSGAEGGPVQPEAEQVRSSVEVMPTADLAARSIAAARSARGRHCIARALAGLAERNVRLRRVATSLSPIPSPLVAVPGSYGLRLSLSAPARAGRPARHLYVDQFGFVLGRAEICLTAMGTPQPVPSALERRLLGVLYNHAQGHRP